MKRLSVAAALLFGGVAFAKAPAKSEKKTDKTAAAAKQASASMEAKSGSTVTGRAVFTQKGKEVVFRLDVDKAPPGEHAVHIHETGDCSSPDGKSAGGHWNPTSSPHGQWGHDGHHMGDIGNLTVGNDGKGFVTLSTDKWAVGDGSPNDVVGKALIVHEKVDDFKTQPTGNAGGRIACGVILGPGGVAPSPAPQTTKPAPAASPAPAKK